MKIVCPSCDATYEVPETIVTSRRKMRCARCSADWVPADILDAARAQQGAAASVAAAPEVAPAPPMAEAPAVFEDAPELAAAGPTLREPPLPEPAPEAEPVPRREDEVYQLALRPETHVSVFAAPSQNPIFNAANSRLVPPPKPRPPVLAWVLSVLLLAGAVTGAWAYRAPVMKVWPPSTRLYAALGLNP
jgi:predicted Zn finger-like uncharacterized protein